MPFNPREIMRSPAIRQAIVVLITIVSLFPTVASLLLSVNQPQVQSNLQLYQIDLNLQASAPLRPGARSVPDPLRSLQPILLGEDPLAAAEERYREALTNTGKSLDSLKIRSAPRKSGRRRGGSVYDLANSWQEIRLKLGIIEAERGEMAEARQRWREIIRNPRGETYRPSLANSARLLEGLYDDSPRVSPGAGESIRRNFRGWFRDTALERLYAVEGRSGELEALRDQRGERAVRALERTIVISLVPLLCATLGIGILIVLGIQLFLQKERSLLYLGKSFSWPEPPDAYTIWLGTIVGFFFVGQILLPLVFSGLWRDLSLDPDRFSLSYQAIYISITYLTMTVASLSVLYLAIAPFRPLPEDWFRFRWLGAWPLWGFGGYLAALPLVIAVSLLNQRLWQGQGGSNPLLTLALESRDTLALLCFAFTAILAAPFFEEIVFRGFLLPSLTRYLPVWGAIALSSLVFALAHQSLSEVFPLTTLGLVLGFVYTRSRNLLSSMLIHGFWNGGTLFSLFLLGGSVN